MGGGSGPAPTGPGPSGGGTPPAAAGPVVAKLERRAAVPTEARAASDGVVAWLADPSKDATADEPLVKLQGFQKWQLQKQQASQRLEFYTAELEKAKTANEASAISYNEKKVEEKKGLVSQAEDELAKVVVPAPASGKMELLVKVGQAVKAGDVVAKITGGAPQLTGTFDAGAAAADYQAPGAACAVAAKGSPDKRAACVVEGVEGSKVTVRLVEGSPFAAGDEVELLPARK
jgi:biotin carboxyl carrier protein